jgi:hypothetical protein
VTCLVNETDREREIHKALIEEIKTEFPTFEIRPKRSSRLQRAIHLFLLTVTLGGQRVYISRYHTVLFGVLWVSDAWDSMSDRDRYVLLRHERIHLRQRARLGDVGMTMVYLFWFFPLGLAYGRARLEWEAYEETLRATTEVFGIDSALALRAWLVDRYCGPDYGWMWPFPGTINRWFDLCMQKIQSQAAHDAIKKESAIR